jgi:hypothetical protein
LRVSIEHFGGVRRWNTVTVPMDARAMVARIEETAP